MTDEEDEDTEFYYGKDGQYHEARIVTFTHPREAVNIQTGETVHIAYYCGEWDEVE